MLIFLFLVSLFGFSVVAVGAGAGARAGILPLPEPIAQPPAPLFPAFSEVGHQYVLQIKVLGIDGTRAGLTQERGFRNFVRRNCADIGLRGFIWRIPRTDGAVLARGTEQQLDRLMAFLHDLTTNHFITGFAIERNRQDYHIPDVMDDFLVVNSRRRHVVTGDYSNPELDDVPSINSAEIIQTR